MMFPQMGYSARRGPSSRLMETRDSCRHMRGDSTLREMSAIDEQRGIDVYDEFAIGWNEIFDQDGWPPEVRRGSLPEPASRVSCEPTLPAAAALQAGRTFSPSTAACSQPPSGPPTLQRGATMSSVVSSHRASLLARATPSSSSPCPRSEAEMEERAPHTAFWSSEAPASKNKKTLPEYMRIVKGGKHSAIERGMKERFMACPTSQVRKPAQVMEGELDGLRHAVTVEHAAKRKEARQLRRLQRRCRVKEHEDLDALQVRYPPRECLRALSDPAERVLTPRQSLQCPAKEFFEELRVRQQPAPPALAPLTVTWRVGGAAPHTVR
mmetsp:Transcript_110861/g.345529  ORF Transcript_110861/g.345529 Transcript_110861/m.345529 type:complete len:324 (-) Transcript_110861:97-1068(-)